MSNTKPRSLLNSITARWLEAPESLAPPVNCHSCSLADARPAHKARWRNYKCCTFQPFVANFICGAMLEAGLAPLDIASHKAVLQPLGVMATQSFRELYLNTDEDLRGEEHLCSYYNKEERNCRIWEFRPGECSLFFCTEDPGQKKRDELTEKVFVLESNVAQMALAHLGYGKHAIEAQVIELNDPDSDLGTLTRKSAEELYRASWEWLKTVKQEEILSWAGF